MGAGGLDDDWEQALLLGPRHARQMMVHSSGLGVCTSGVEVFGPGSAVPLYANSHAQGCAS